MNPIKFAIVSLLTLGHDAGTGPGVSWSHPPPPTPGARDGADEEVTTAIISMLSLIAFCLGLVLIANVCTMIVAGSSDHPCPWSVSVTSI